MFAARAITARRCCRCWAGVRLRGAWLVVVEKGRDSLQEAFVREGAVQCGFCIPGMILAAKALLDQASSPSVTEIQQALAGNLCRCGGYSRIIRAVQSAAEANAKVKGKAEAR